MIKGASYLSRYDILCQRLVREQLYTSASLITSPSGVEFKSRHSSLGFILRRSVATPHLLDQPGCVVQQVQASIRIGRCASVPIGFEHFHRHCLPRSPRKQPRRVGDGQRRGIQGGLAVVVLHLATPSGFRPFRHLRHRVIARSKSNCNQALSGDAKRAFP